MRELILGGARSGKSRLAEARAAASGLRVAYIATASPGDAEMAARIAEHRQRRPIEWRTRETPLYLAHAMLQESGADRCLLVDCLTLWLANLLAAGDEALAEQRQALLEVLPELPGQIILVSNEVGLGVVPMGELSRRFCDQAGGLNQDLVRLCERVTFTVAGLSWPLKGAD